MNLFPLTEHRCECGKLLFKGLLFLGVVEVKCRRCGALYVSQKFEMDKFLFIECDASLSIVSVLGNLHRWGYDSKSLIGSHSDGLLPFLNDTALQKRRVKNKDGAYTIHNNPMLLRDGRSQLVTSHVIPKKKDTVFDGYQIMNWVIEPHSAP